MASLLYIKASPRGDRSHSITVAEAFVEAYKTAHPGDSVEVLDLFATDLPTFDGLALQAKYAILGGGQPSEEQREAWGAIEAIIARFTVADRYVLAVPMWNFGIPYRLKQYLDILIQPSYTFAYIPGEGYRGLVPGKPVLAVYSRGGEYGPGNPIETYDFQKPYLELALRFIGFEDIRSLVVEGTLMVGGDELERRRAAAIAEAREMAAAF